MKIVVSDQERALRAKLSDLYRRVDALEMGRVTSYRVESNGNHTSLTKEDIIDCKKQIVLLEDLLEQMIGDRAWLEGGD